MGYYTFEPGAVEAILSTSDLKPQDIQLLGSLAVTIMLDRVTEVTTTGDEDVVVHEAIITEEDVLEATDLAVREKEAEYQSLWQEFGDHQRIALISAAASTGCVGPKCCGS